MCVWTDVATCNILSATVHQVTEWRLAWWSEPIVVAVATLVGDSLSPPALYTPPWVPHRHDGVEDCVDVSLSLSLSLSLKLFSSLGDKMLLTEINTPFWLRPNNFTSRSQSASVSSVRKWPWWYLVRWLTLSTLYVFVGFDCCAVFRICVSADLVLMYEFCGLVMLAHLSFFVLF